MKINDAEVLKELKRVRSGELWCRMEDFPDDEVDGRSDMQMLADELSWLIENFEECGCCLHEDLEEAREILRETRYGKVIPLWKDSLKPVYDKHRIQSCKDTVNEYNRLKTLMKRLNAKGIYGKW